MDPGAEKKVSVCCVSQSFLPYIGGLARYVEALGKKFMQNGHEFKVIHFKTSTISPIDFSCGIEMIRANVPNVGKETLEKYLSFKEQILEVTQENSNYDEHDGFEEYLEVNEMLAHDVIDAFKFKPFDILNVHDFQVLPLARILKTKYGFSSPVVFTWHVPLTSEISPWWKNFFVEYMSDYDRLVFSTDEYVEAAAKLGIPREKIVKISPFIDFETYKVTETNVARQKYGLKDDDFVVLCVSRIDPRKGQEILVDAIDLLLKKHCVKNIKGVFVGNGSFSSELLKKERSGRLHKLVEMVNEKGLNDFVVFAGKLEGEALYQVYASCDVVVQPSLQEGFGLTISEGMAFEKPVIGSNVGGIPDQIQDGVNGFLFEKGNSQQLAEKILALIQNPELGKKMGSIGLEIVKKKFSSETGYSEYLALYKQALEKH